MALTPQQVTILYRPLREWMARVSANQHAAPADALERILRDLAGLIAEINTDEDGETIDLTAILARLTAVEALAAEALQAAVQQVLLMRMPPTMAQIRAALDDALKVPNGDWFLTPGGDRLLMPSAG